MFGISGFELIILAVLALLVFGPDKLPGMAQDAGRMIRQLRKMADDARAEVTGVFPEFDDMDLRDLDPRHFVRKQLLEEKDDLDAALEGKPGKASTNGSRRKPVEVAPEATHVPEEVSLGHDVPDVEPAAEVAEVPSPWDADAT